MGEGVSKIIQFLLFLLHIPIISHFILHFIFNMLGCIHYGSTNETYKIAYSKQALSPRFGEYEFYQVRKLPGPKKTPHRLLFLRFLSGEKGSGLD